MAEGEGRMPPVDPDDAVIAGQVRAKSRTQVSGGSRDDDSAIQSNKVSNLDGLLPKAQFRMINR